MPQPEKYQRWQTKQFPLFADMAELCQGHVADGCDALDITQEAGHDNDNDNNSCTTQHTEDRNAEHPYSFNSAFDSTVCASFAFYNS